MFLQSIIDAPVPGLGPQHCDPPLLVPKNRRRKDRYSQIPKKIDNSGNVVIMEPKETVWWNLYVECPPLHNEQFCRKFRRRFRMPHANFLELTAKVESSPLF